MLGEAHTARGCLTSFRALLAVVDPQGPDILTHSLLIMKLSPRADIKTTTRGYKGFLEKTFDRSLKVADLLFPNVGIILRVILVTLTPFGHVTQVEALLGVLDVFEGHQRDSDHGRVLIT